METTLSVYVTTLASGEVLCTTSLAAIYDHLTARQVGVSLSRFYHLPLPYTSPRCRVAKYPLYRKKQKF